MKKTKVHDEKGFLYTPILCIYEDGRPSKTIKTWKERQNKLKNNKHLTIITTYKGECIFKIHKS